MNNIISINKHKQKPKKTDLEFQVKMLEEEVLHLSKLVNRLIYELKKERNASDND